MLSITYQGTPYVESPISKSPRPLSRSLVSPSYKSSYKDIEAYPTIKEYLKRIQTSTYQPLTERNAFFIARLLFSVKAFNNHLSSYFRQKVNRKVRE